MAKLKELNEPDVNASDEHAPSGRLIRHGGEKAALRYKPVRTPNGSFLIVASQSPANDREVAAIGRYHGVGRHEWHRTRKAAQADMHARRKRDGDPDAGRSYFLEVTHVDPTDGRRAARAASKARDERASAASGKLYRRTDGEPAARRYMPVYNGRNYLIVAFQGDENRAEVSKHGRFAGNPSGPRSFAGQKEAKQSLFEARKQAGDPDARKAFFTYVVHVDPTGSAAESRSRSRSSGELEHAPSGRARAGGSDASVLGESAGAAFASELRDRAGSLRGLKSDVIMKILATHAEQEAVRRARAERLSARDARAFIDAFVGTAVHQAMSRASGAISSGAKRGLAIAAAGVAVVGITAAAHMALKSSAAQPG